MGALQKELDKITSELCSDKSLMLELARHIGTKRGLDLNDEQCEALAAALQIEPGSDGRLEATIDCIPQDIEITTADVDDALKNLEADFEGRIERTIASSIQELSPDILKSLYDDAPDALRHRRTTASVFRRTLMRHWQKGLDRLEMLIMIAQEAGESHIKEIEDQIDQDETVSDNEKALFHALVPLHARACQIASEALHLLTGGYADGANARWRSLHEVAVTAMFLAEKQGDTAQRFLDHSFVERHRAAEQYQKHWKTLGFDKFTDDEMDEISTEAEAMIHKYGPKFDLDYGWASQALGTSKPSFTKIEAALDLSHWRPFFKMACQSVHAGSQGIHTSLGVLGEPGSELLVGSSDAGLCDPGQNTAISLTMASSALLTFRPNLDSLVTATCMKLLIDDVRTAFFEAHEQQIGAVDLGFASAGGPG